MGAAPQPLIAAVAKGFQAFLLAIQQSMAMTGHRRHCGLGFLTLANPRGMLMLRFQ
jgi:hypothetical protein